MPIPIAVWIGGAAVSALGAGYFWGQSDGSNDVDTGGGDYTFDESIDLGPLAYYGFLTFAAYLAWKLGSSALKSFDSASSGA